MPYLDVPGTTLYYEDEGAGDRSLLFLHGWGTSARVWGAQLPEFVRTTGSSRSTGAAAAGPADRRGATR